jgi:hypothetical protein
MSELFTATFSINKYSASGEVKYGLQLTNPEITDFDNFMYSIPKKTYTEVPEWSELTGFSKVTENGTNLKYLAVSISNQEEPAIVIGDDQERYYSFSKNGSVVTGSAFDSQSAIDRMEEIISAAGSETPTITFTFELDAFKKKDNHFVNVSPETDINKILYLLECSIHEVEPETPAAYPDYKVSMAKIAHGDDYTAVDPNQYPSIAESLKYILDNYSITLTPKN